MRTKKDSTLVKLVRSAILVLSVAACAFNNNLFSDPLAFSDSDCLRSGAHTLQRTEDGYLCVPCVPSVSTCEEGFAQGTDKPSVSTVKPGCTYIPGDCYCPPGGNVICVCGGGELAMCI